MRAPAKIATYVVSALVVVGLVALAVPAVAPLLASASDTAEASTRSAPPKPTATPDPVVTELPEWAKNPGQVWIIYPEGMECHGTEGCGNSFRHLIGEPSWPLPENVEYYGGPTTQEWLRQGFGGAVPGKEGTWSEEDKRRLVELGIPTELPVPTE